MQFGSGLDNHRLSQFLKRKNKPPSWMCLAIGVDDQWATEPLRTQFQEHIFLLSEPHVA